MKKWIEAIRYHITLSRFRFKKHTRLTEVQSNWFVGTATQDELEALQQFKNNLGGN